MRRREFAREAVRRLADGCLCQAGGPGNAGREFATSGTPSPGRVPDRPEETACPHDHPRAPGLLQAPFVEVEPDPPTIRARRGPRVGFVLTGSAIAQNRTRHGLLLEMSGRGPWRCLLSRAGSADQSVNPVAQDWKNRRLEPGILPCPVTGSPAWMRRWQVGGQELLPARDCFRQGRAAPLAEVARLGVSPHQQRQFDGRHRCQQCLMPQRRAFRARRRVTAPWQHAGIAEAHRHDGNPTFIVESLTIHLQPIPQPVATRIVPRDAALVHPDARRLSDDQDAGGGGDAQNGSWTQRQMLGAVHAGTHFREQAALVAGQYPSASKRST